MGQGDQIFGTTSTNLQIEGGMEAMAPVEQAKAFAALTALAAWVGDTEPTDSAAQIKLSLISAVIAEWRGTKETEDGRITEMDDDVALENIGIILGADVGGRDGNRGPIPERTM